MTTLRRSLRNGLCALIGTGLTCGCSYKGAIYSSYQEGGLGIRTTAESDAPVKVHFGYDQSVAAFVPRRGDDPANEEATAIISKDEVGANVNPTTTGTKDLLTVDSALITGTAAIVASAPANAQVTVTSPSTQRTYVTNGRAGDRIATALNPVIFNSDPDAAALRTRINTWMKQQPQNRTSIKAWLSDQGFASPATGSEASWLWSAPTNQLQAAITKFSIP